MDIDFTAVRKKAQEKYGPKGGEFQKGSIDFEKVRERAKEKYGTLAHDRQLDFQDDQSTDVADSSVGTADLSGPPEPTSDDEPDYQPYSQPASDDTKYKSALQPASNYAAGYQGAPQSTGIPYAAGLQETQPERVNMGGGSYIGVTPKTGMSEEEELRWESRQRSQLAKGVTPERLAEKGLNFSQWTDRQNQAAGASPRPTSATDMVREQEDLIDDWDEIVKGLNGSYKILTARKVGLEKLDQAYQESQAPMWAHAYNQALAEYRQEAEKYDRYLRSYQAYTTPEAFQGRIDDWEAQLPELEEQEKAAKKALGTERSILSGTMRYGTAEQRAQAQARADAAEKAYQDIVEQNKTLQEKIAQEKFNKEYMAYEALRQNPDFEDGSVYKTTANGLNPVFDRTEGVLVETGFDDIRYDAINGNDTARSMIGDAGFVPYEDITPDQVKLFNYIYATKGPKEAYNYMDLIAKKQFTAMDAAGMKFMKGSGIAYPSIALSAAVGNALAKLTGDEDMEVSTDDLYQDFMMDAQQATEQHPMASAVGSVAGTMALMTGIAKGLTFVPGFASLPGIAQASLSGAASMGGSTAVQGLGDVATGYLEPGEYALNVLGSATAGAAGGAAASGTGAAGTAFLRSRGLTENMLARTVVAGIAGAAGGTARAGVTQGGQYLRDPYGYEPDMGVVAEEALVGFAFSTFGYLTRNYTASPVEAAKMDADEAKAKELFGGLSEAEAKVKYRQMARDLHPDLHPGDAAAEAEMKAVNGAWEWYTKNMMGQKAAEGAAAYQKAQSAAKTGDMAVYQEATAAYDQSVAEIVALAAESRAVTETEEQAIQILQAISEAGIGGGTEAMEELGVTVTKDMTQAQRTEAVEDRLRQITTDEQSGEEQKTAPGTGAVKTDGESYTVVKRLRESIPGLADMGPVASVSAQKVRRTESGQTMAGVARKLFDDIKGIVSRKGFGNVEINQRSVKDDLSHGIGPAKAAVIPAIPAIIQNGKQIDFQEGWKGRGYDGYVFAAPVIMDGDTVYVAAVVKRSSKNRFYLHEVVDSNGNIIKIDSGDEATQTSLAAESGAGTPSPLPTNPIIPVTENGVKEKFAPGDGKVRYSQKEVVTAQWNQGETSESLEGEKKLALGSDLVSDEAADKLLNDRTSVAFLEKHGNLNLRKGMTQEQKRAAIRQAVENVVHKGKTDIGGEGSLDTTGDERYDEGKKTVSGGLTDGGEETRLDGGEKASDSRDGGEVLWGEAWTGHTGDRSVWEKNSAFVERAKAEGKIVRKSGRGYYAYSITPQENYAPETQKAVKAAEEWGLASTVVDSFERNNGEKTFTGMAAITGPEGQVFLVNGCDKEEVAHEGLHSGLRRDIPEAKQFAEAVCEIDITSDEMAYALEKIGIAYYDETGREFDLEHLKEETSAFISGMIETGQAEKFFGLTEENSPELFAAWREFKAAMGANPITPDQDGSASTGELSYLQKDTLKPIDGGLISDEMADHLLGDRSSVSFLTRKGGLKLSKKMTKEQRRAAVKKAVERITNKGTVSGDRRESIQMQLGSDDMVPQKEAQQQEIEDSEETGIGIEEKKGEKVKDFAIIKQTLIGGALDPESERAGKHAEQYYESVRKMTTDVKRIAENTGIPEAVIQRIKNFIFMDAHDLGEGKIERFDPMYEMAESWQRLIDGKNIQPHDFTLLWHEIMEEKLMDQGYTQDEAHRITSRRYNYTQEAHQYYDKIRKHKSKG